MSSETPNKDTVTITAGDEFNASDLDFCVHSQLIKQLKREIIKYVPERRGLGDEFKQEDMGVYFTGRERNYLFTGGRGSGKSTFLRILVKQLLTDEKTQKSTGLQELCWFDPSESSGGEDYFFLTIAAALKSKFEEAIKERRREEKDYDFRVDKCKDSMKALDKGLVRLSQARKAIADLTPQKAAELRLSSPELDDSIRNNFYKVVDLLCDICKVKAFIIAIDDADTRSAQSFRVLEDLRLYIRHPRLIILMTGDKHMYLERIRENLFREYNVDYHRADVKGQQARMDMVVSHAGQYLIKLFPLANQRELVDMYTLMTKQKPITYNLKLIEKDDKQEKSEERTLPLKDCVKKLFAQTISTEDAEIKPFVELFFRLPLRSILQAINYWDKGEIWGECRRFDELKLQYDKEKGCLNQAKSESSKKKKKENLAQTWQELLDKSRNITYPVKMAMTRVLQDELRSYYYNFDSLDADEGRMYYSAMLRHCQNTRDLEHGYFLSGGVGGSSEEKYITMMLATAFKSRVSTIEGFLYYLLHGPATVTLFAKAEALKKNKEGDAAYLINYNPEEFPEQFNDFMQVGRDISASRWARRANLILAADNSHAGALKLNLEAASPTSSNQNSENSSTNAVTILQKWFKKTEGEDESTTQESEKPGKSEKPKVTKEKKLLAVLVSLSRTEPHENKNIISLYSYLAFVLKCCTACHAINERRPAKDKEKLQPEDKEKLPPEAYKPLHDLIKDYFSIKSCMYPDWLRINNCSSGSLEIFDSSSYTGCLKDKTELSGSAKKIAEEIYKWYDDEDKTFLNSLTPHRVGDIWAEIFYTLERTASHASLSEKNNPFNLFQQAITKTLFSNDSSIVKLVDNHLNIDNENQNKPVDFTKLCEEVEKKEITQTSSPLSFIQTFPLTKSLLVAFIELSYYTENPTLLETGQNANT